MTGGCLELYVSYRLGLHLNRKCSPILLVYVIVLAKPVPGPKPLYHMEMPKLCDELSDPYTSRKAMVVDKI